MPTVIDLLSSDDEISPVRSATNTLAGFNPRKEKANSSNLKQAVQNARQPSRPTENGFARTSANGADASAITKHDTTPIPVHSRTTSNTATPVSVDRSNAPSLAELLQRDAESSARKNGWHGQCSLSPPARQAPPVRKSNMAKRSSGAVSLQRAEKAQAVQAREKAKRDDREPPRDNIARRNRVVDGIREPPQTAQSPKLRLSPSPNGVAKETRETPKRNISPAAQDLQPSLKRRREDAESHPARSKIQEVVRGSSETERKSAPSVLPEILPRPRRSLNIEQESDDDSDDIPDMIPAKPARKTNEVEIFDGLPAVGTTTIQETAAPPIQAPEHLAVEQPNTTARPTGKGGPGPSRRKTKEQKQAERDRAVRAQALIDAGLDLPLSPLQDRREQHQRSGNITAPQMRQDSEPPRGTTPLVFNRGHAAGLTANDASRLTPPGQAAASITTTTQSPRQSGKSWRPYTADEDELLIRLRYDSSIRWDEMPQHFQDRTQAGLQNRYSSLKKDSTDVRLGSKWTAAEDRQLLHLRQEVKLPWDDMPQHFEGRTPASLQDRYMNLKKDAGELKATGLFSRWTPEEDARLLRLRRQDPKPRWDEMPQHFPGRNAVSIKNRYANMKKGRNETGERVSAPKQSAEDEPSSSLTRDRSRVEEGEAGPSRITEEEAKSSPEKDGRGIGASEPGLGHPATTETLPSPKNDTNEVKSGGFGSRYSPEEDALLVYLKQKANVRWEDMPTHFKGRTQGSLQVRYSGLKRAADLAIQARAVERGVSTLATTATPDSDVAEYSAPARRKHKTEARTDGFVTWAEVKAKRLDSPYDTDAMDIDPPTPGSIRTVQLPAEGLAARDVAHPSSLSRVLRAREMGSNAGRGRHNSTKPSEELKSHVLDSLGPRRMFNGTSRDVTCVAWAPDGNRFAAGSIAISDPASMQYNRPYNLLLGDVQRNSVLELPEHHIPRPKITDGKNVNSLHGMQVTQDSRLFMTVAAVEFSHDGRRLFTGGGDCVSRVYDARDGKCLDAFTHGATVDLLSWNNNGILATACHRSDDEAIRVFQCKRTRFSAHSKLNPSRTASTPVFPTALKWGRAPAHRKYLLAGFSSDTYDIDHTAAGEVCLWDVETGSSIPMVGSSRNVFDVAWNPSPGSGSSLFAVASAKAGRRIRSVVQCIALGNSGLRPVLEWDCQAADMNDVAYCPHDDNLVAAGATDGNVYLWDRRFASRNQAPLHILRHGETKNVLDHDRDRELADTGVRFLSWSATANRLYSGSSDGVVKVWNPYRTTEDALVKNVATFKSAIMSGAFSHDYRDLLIGEDQGQLNLLSIDREGRSVHAAKRFDLHTAKLEEEPAEDKCAASRELLESGQIEFRPMGALPVRQAVQGPNYSGPFMKPSSEHFDWLTEEYKAAEAESQRAKQQLEEDIQTQDSEPSKAVHDAEARLAAVKEAWTKAAQRRLDFHELEPDAKRLQLKFLADEAKAGSSLDRAKRRCRLDCDYLPGAGDDDGEAPDDRRSEQRVPGALRSQRTAVDPSDLTNAEVAEAGLTGKCSACMGPCAAPSKGKASLCSWCSLTRSGLTARCARCALPARPRLGNPNEQNLCQQCDFRCFRCGLTTDLALRVDMVQCEPCGLAWEMGLLGYELKTTMGKKMGGGRKKRRDDEDDFGEEETERLAAGWRVPLVDGTA